VNKIPSKQWLLSVYRQKHLRGVCYTKLIFKVVATFSIQAAASERSMIHKTDLLSLLLATADAENDSQMSNCKIIFSL
jgi:hypothetical protein